MSEYPFPVPQSTLDGIHYISMPLHERYDGLDPTQPLALDCLDNWHTKFRAQVDILRELVGFGADFSLFIPGIFFALENLSNDFSDLLWHARTSLPHDPVMKKWIAEALEETLVSTRGKGEDGRQALTTEDETARLTR